MKRAKFDTPWKLVIERFFKHLMEMLLPLVAADIDWTQPHEFLDQELLEIQKSTQIGKRITDKLIKVCKKDGNEAWVLIHLEIQGAQEVKFPERMFQYFYKTYDKYKIPLMSLAILTDKNIDWRPNAFYQTLWGCRLCLEFPIIKLLDFKDDEMLLEKSHNPIAKVIQAHLTALSTRGIPTLRYENKLKLVKKLYPLGYEMEDIRILYSFMDYVLMLPNELEKQFIIDMKKHENEVNMHYVTSAERFGREDGLKLGERKVLQLLLENKFGHLRNEILDQLNQADIVQLEKMAKDILNAKSLEDLFSTVEN